MGDAVIGNLIDKGGEPKARLTQHLDKAFAIDAYVVIASESQRPAALAAAQSLRDAGLRVHLPFGPAKVGKQFQTAETYQASVAVVVGDEFPEIGIKNLVTRAESTVPGPDALVSAVQAIIDNPHPGGLIA